MTRWGGVKMKKKHTCGGVYKLIMASLSDNGFLVIITKTKIY